MATSDPSVIHWRTSSSSGDSGTCVEVTALPDGRIPMQSTGRAVRNSTRPDGVAILFTRVEMNHWINGIKAGEFDDLIL